MSWIKAQTSKDGVHRGIEQILVVVASIQVTILKTEVEKGFIGTVVGYELDDPKAIGNFCLRWQSQANILVERESGLIFLILSR